jgi:DNA processing protein
LIRQGAKLVERAEDILEELRWEKVGAGGTARRPATAATARDEAPSALLAQLDDAPVSLDALSARSGLTPADLLAMLLSLELEGRVAQLPGGLYQRVNRGQGPN